MDHRSKKGTPLLNENFAIEAKTTGTRFYIIDYGLIPRNNNFSNTEKHES